MITLSKSSGKDDIRMYIQKQTKKNLIAITEAFKAGNGKVVTDTFRDDIKNLTGKTIKESFITNTVWDLVQNRIKMGY